MGMKAEFDKYQKLLLKTQIEKSFRLRADEDDKEKHDDDDIIANINIDDQDIDNEYEAMSKMMLNYRSTKMFETTIEPHIKPQHQERFNSLMRDIGIVNEHIMDKLWSNIENTVYQNNDEQETKNDDLRKQLKSMQDQISSLQQMDGIIDSDDGEML